MCIQRYCRGLHLLYFCLHHPGILQFLPRRVYQKKKSVRNPHVCICQIFDKSVSNPHFSGRFNEKLHSLQLGNSNRWRFRCDILRSVLVRVCSSYFCGGSVQLVQSGGFYKSPLVQCSKCSQHFFFVERSLSLCSWTESAAPPLPSIGTPGAHCK